MRKFTEQYEENRALLHAKLRIGESFDLIERRLTIGRDELTLYYIDGFVKDTVMQRLMQYFVGLPGLPRGEGAASRFVNGNVPYVEVDETRDTENAVLRGGLQHGIGDDLGQIIAVADDGRADAPGNSTDHTAHIENTP